MNWLRSAEVLAFERVMDWLTWLRISIRPAAMAAATGSAMAAASSGRSAGMAAAAVRRLGRAVAAAAVRRLGRALGIACISGVLLFRRSLRTSCSSGEWKGEMMGVWFWRAVFAQSYVGMTAFAGYCREQKKAVRGRRNRSTLPSATTLPFQFGSVIVCG